MAPASSSLLRRDVSAALQVLAARVVVKAHQLMLPPVHTRGTRTGESLLQLIAITSSSRHLQQASMDEAVEHFVEAVEALVAFVTTFAKTDKFVFHLASMRRMYLDLYAVGSQLDLVAEIAGLKTVEDTTWPTQLLTDREEEETQLSLRAAKNALPFARNMMPHEPMEALTLLKFEIDFFKPGNSVKHVASMKKVFFSVVRSSNGRVARIPDWYIPAYAVNYSREKVMAGSVGTAHRGIWVDRKPPGGKKPEKDEEGGEQKPTTYNVVVKRLLIHADAIEFFRQEVEIWFGMDHPNVLKLYGASHCSRPALIVCEDAANGPLLDYLNGLRQSHAKTFNQSMWRLFLQAAQGLRFLHQKNIVHSDLKSDNIVVTADCTVKLMDFGLGVLSLQNQAVQDNKFEELGWRAPNWLRNKKLLRRPAFQDDIYSFGLCVLDVLVPSLSSVVFDGDPNAPKHVGDEGFDPLSPKVMTLIRDKGARDLIAGMCQTKPEERLTLDKVISRMETLSTRTTSKGSLKSMLSRAIGA